MSQQSDREPERKGSKQGARRLVDVIIRIVKHGKEFDKSALDLQASYLPEATIAAAVNTDQ